MKTLKEKAGFFAEYVAWLTLTVMVIVMTMGTVMRYFFHNPLLFQVDLISGLLVIFCCVGFTPVFLRGGHVRVTIVTDHFPKRVQDWFYLFAEVLTIVFNFLMVIVMVPLISHSLKINATFDVMMVPLAPFQIVAALGFGLFGLVVFVDFCKRSKELLKRGEG